MAAQWSKIPASELNNYVTGSAREGLSFSTIAQGSPSSASGQQFIAALKKAGWTDTAIAALEKGPSTFQQLLDQLGQSALIPPLGEAGAAVAGGAGAEGGAAAEGAAGGAAGGSAASAGAGALSTAAKTIGGATIAAGIWQWLTTASNWLRILEYVGGAVLIYLGIKGLTGIGPDLSDVAAVAK